MKKVFEGFALVENGNEIELPLYLKRYKNEFSKNSLSRPDCKVIAVTAEAGRRGEHGFVITIDDKLSEIAFEKGLIGFDKAECAVRTAGWLLKDDSTNETLKKFYRFYKPFKLDKMGPLFDLFAARGIKIEPLDYYLPAGFSFEKQSVKDGDRVENRHKPYIERIVKVSDGIYKVGHDDLYDSERALGFFWRKVDGSPALRFFRMFVNKIKDQSENRRRGYFYSIVNACVEGRMEFDKDDFNSLQAASNGLFVAHERLYKLAIESMNQSAEKAYEHYIKREPFYLAGKKLHVDKTFMWKGFHVNVTSFSGDGSTVVACHQEYEKHMVKTRKVFKITRDDIAAQSEIDIALNDCAAALIAKLESLGFEYIFGNRRLAGGNGEMRCFDCAEAEWGGKETEYVDAIDEIVLRCAGCKKFLYTNPSSKRLNDALDSFVLDTGSVESLLAMKGFLKIAYENTEKIVALCQPLVEWHKNSVKMEHQRREDD